MAFMAVKVRNTVKIVQQATVAYRYTHTHTPHTCDDKLEVNDFSKILCVATEIINTL